MKVVLIDDHALVRRGVRELLETRGVVVAADLPPSEDVLSLAAEYEPDLLILDLAMPQPDGLSLLRRWREKQTKTPVLVLSMHAEQPWPSLALAAGAKGFLSKSSGPDELVAAIESVLAGRPAFSPEVSAVLEGAKSSKALPRLTPREKEVLRQVCQGATIADLARHLVVSHNTAKSHLHSLYRKLGVSDRTQLLLMAKELGFESNFR